MLYALIAIIVIIILWAISVYNSLVTLLERVNNAKAQIATQIESRWDALKSLIDATKKYSEHEATLLGNVTEQRTSIGRGSSVSEIEKDEEQFNNVLGRLIAVSEAYPDLKASQVYQTTMNSIDKYENNVRNSRMIYNDTVTRYNRRTRVFPSNILAGMFNFTEREYFDASEDKQDMPGWD